MPEMMCGNCSKVVHYRNRRGCKAPKVCPDCKGELKKAAFYPLDEGGYEYRIVKTQIKKGKMINCKLCGRRRKSTGYNAVKINKDTEFKVIRGSYLTYKDVEMVTIKAGDYVCWSHLPDFPIRISNKV